MTMPEQNDIIIKAMKDIATKNSRISQEVHERFKDSPDFQRHLKYLEGIISKGTVNQYLSRT